MPGVLENLKVTFLGVLGWLDAPFKPFVYKVLGLMLIFNTSITVSVAAIRQNKAICLTLLCCLCCSVLMIYLALLISWNPHPATFIEGVQGRYFLIPAAMFAYALSPIEERKSSLYITLKVFTLGGLLPYSSHATVKLLMLKYYVQ